MWLSKIEESAVCCEIQELLETANTPIVLEILKMKVKCVRCGKNGSLTIKTTITRGRAYRYYYVEHSEKRKKSWCFIGKTLPNECLPTGYTKDTQKHAQQKRLVSLRSAQKESLGRALIPRPTAYEAIALPS
jgi:hypothetical protein